MTERPTATDREAEPDVRRKPWYASLFVQLLIGIVGGIAIGWLWPGLGADLKPLADGFIKLIKMLIAPIIFCTVVIGIAHVGDLKSVGRIGVKALVYFELITTFALVFGLVVGNIVKPGSGFSIDPQTLATGAEAVDQKTGSGELPHTVDFLLNIIPTSVVSAFAENALLQVLFFAVLFGLALAKFGEKGPPIVLELVDHISHIFFTIIGWIMRLAPIGAFGAMAYIVGQYGISSLGSYGKLIACCYLAAVLFILVLAAVARYFAGVNLWKFLRYIKDELFLALGTASTEVVLPRIMVKLTEAGCSRTTTGLVVPTGYSFNLDGGGTAAHHGQADRGRVLPHDHRSGGSDGIFVQPRRSNPLSVDLHSLSRAGSRRRPDTRRADRCGVDPDADLQRHGRSTGFVVPRIVGDRCGHRARVHPGCGRGVAARCRPDHGLHASIGEPSRQLRRDIRRGELGGPTRQRANAQSARR